MKKTAFVISTILFSALAFAGGKKDITSQEYLNKAYPADEYFVSAGQGATMANAQSAAKLGICQSLGESLTGQQQISQTSATGKEDEGCLSIKVNENVTFSNITGIQIVNSWQPDKDKADWRAIAVLNKKEAAAYYSKLAKENDSKISSGVSSALLKAPSFESISLMDQAIQEAKDNQYNLDLLHAISQSQYSMTKMSYGSVNALKLKKTELAKGLSVNLTVENDNNGVVFSALKAKLLEMGTSVVSSGALYSINAKITVEGVPSIDNGKNQYVRYVFEAPALNTSTGAIGKDFGLTGREGQPTKEKAVQRAYAKIAARIADEF